MIARARASWAARVFWSRRARLAEYAQIARHAPVSRSGFQTGSVRNLVSLTRVLPCRGVTVSMTWPSVKRSPFQWKWDSRSPGALVTREPTMNDRFTSSSAARLVCESMPASAATTIGVPCRWWRARKLVMIGTIVVVSAVLPSKQPISKGNPVRSTSSPTTI